jgi:hypothetical protein
MTINIAGGKQVCVSSDLGKIRMSLWANRGSLGLELTKQEAIALRAALFRAILEIEQG